MEASSDEGDKKKGEMLGMEEELNYASEERKCDGRKGVGKSGKREERKEFK